MKNQKGITLVALVITIIVMLILVSVSVAVALNGGLISKTKDVKQQWQTADNDVGNTHNEVTYNGAKGVDNIVNQEYSAE